MREVESVSSVPMSADEMADAMLEAARQIKNDPDHWCQGEYFRDRKGKRTYRGRAYSSCAIGRLSLVTGLKLPELWKLLGPVAQNIVDANDVGFRSAARHRVVAELRKTARKLRRQSA